MWKSVCCLAVVLQVSLAWESLPQLPSGRRSQYYLLNEDGGYKYGFDTGSGYFAKQLAGPNNEVEGHYIYPVDGQLVDVKYKSGVDGFQIENANFPNAESLKVVALKSYLPPKAASWSEKSSDSSNGPSDASYKFSYSTGDSSRQESADAAGNINGKYSYTNEAGQHDLSYVAGSDTGFLVTGGSLAAPNANGFVKSNSPADAAVSSGSWASKTAAPAGSESSSDGSYSFSYNTGNSERQESADSAGTVRGKYSYSDDAGHHDLSYKAGADTGFVVTGGSLAQPKAEGYATKAAPAVSSGSWASKTSTPAEIMNSGTSDGSYSFSYNAGDSSRQESADSTGKVRGSYTYTNDAGQHDLSYVAGSDTGFLVTGGSLAAPKSDGYGSKSSGMWTSKTSAQVKATGLWSTENAVPVKTDAAFDGSYSFSYNTGDSSRQESADNAGNVQGKYSYSDDAGKHDLSYIAGADTGFVVTGGSLATPNAEGYATKTAGSWASNSAQSTGSWSSKTAEPANIDANKASDGSYSFSYNTGDSSRQESADSAGNVQGKYSYSDDAGNHDLSYTAGGDTGFVVTGGSLATPNAEGYTSKTSGSWASKTNVPAQSSGSWNSKTAQTAKIDSSAATDGSYSFSYNTGDSSRQESADSAGNVQGKYSYSDDAGNHDLSYTAGGDTGFVVTGGSLATPNAEGYTSKTSGSWASKTSVPAQSSGSWNSKTAETAKIDSSAATDGSYSFSYNTGDSSRQEAADSAGNVQGKYTYSDDAGKHDLSYTAGADTGFVVTGGSLATPNVGGYAAKTSGSWASNPAQSTGSWSSKTAEPANTDVNTASDGSYSFSYNTGDSSRQESADSAGNVQGKYSYSDDAGNHDLSYTAGADTGFVVTGGSLATPNVEGYTSKTSGSWASKTSAPAQASGSWSSKAAETAKIDSNTATDGSYSFSYNTGDSSRQESADSSGNVQGKYSYSDDAGHHDLSYTAGGDSGFVVTGGSLATPNTEGYTSKTSGSWTTKTKAPVQSSSTAAQDDGSSDSSYTFSYNAGNSERQESTDSAGNVRGKYSYSDDAGQHDLSYTAGANSGFVVTGGSLATPNAEGYASKTSGSWSTKTVEPAKIMSNGASDGSYSFSYNAGDSSRHESADSAGNVQGKYSYSDDAGNHDLSYAAGADTGFVVTGGSLANPNVQGYTSKTSGSWASKTSTPDQSSGSWASKTAEKSKSDSNVAPDGSYTFSYNDGNSERQETADVAGNVKGRYSYKNSAGSHDLHYTAGSETGFLVTGGSLASPNGLEAGLKTTSSSSGAWTKSSASQDSGSSTASRVSYTLPSGVSQLKTSGADTLVIKYLPVQQNPKFGYIFDSQ